MSKQTIHTKPEEIIFNQSGMRGGKSHAIQEMLRDSSLYGSGFKVIVCAPAIKTSWKVISEVPA